MPPAESESQNREELHFVLVSQLLEAFPRSLQADMLAQYGSYRAIFTQSDASVSPVAAIQEQYHQGRWQSTHDQRW